MESRWYRRKEILKIVLYYAIVGQAWIYGSDTVSRYLTSDPEVLTQLAIFKGSAYVVVTSLLLYFLIQRYAAKSAELELKAIGGERRFRELFKNVADPIYIADIDGNFIDANDRACLELGYTLDELLRLNVTDVDVKGDLQQQVLSRLPADAETGVTVFESYHRRKDGSVFPVEVNASLTNLAGQRTVMGVARNLSNRKPIQEFKAFLATAASRPSGEDFFQSLARYLAETLQMDYICIDSLEDDNLAATTVAVYFDGKFEDNVTYTLNDTPCGEVVGRSVCCYTTGVRHQFPNDLVLQEMLAESYIGTILWGTNGKKIGLIAAISRKPLHNRELAEEILQVVSVRAAAELERNIHEEQRMALEKQILQAQKLESLGVLAGGIAHDFNNLLTAIVGNVDLALLKISPDSPGIDHLHRIDKAAAKATDLAKQMLAYSGRGKFKVESIRLNRLLEDMLHMLEVSISKKAELRLQLSEVVPPVEADATQIRQIIMNLIINASEAIGDQGGVITISSGCLDCDKNYLSDFWQDEKVQPGRYAFVEVADTGCGMTPEEMRKIFDPFYTTKFTGRGLGLAAVLGIIRGHHGAIKVSSEKGKGSSFRVLLPASKHPEAPASISVTHHDWRGAGKILLVDDEEAVRGIGREMLQELGFEVVTANDGRQALDTFRKYRDFQLVILDLTMPQLDGEQCFQHLRQIDPEVKVILSSGYSDEEVSRKFEGTGVCGFIQKPYKISDLRNVLAHL